MPNLSNLTLEQLRAATKAQIITAIGNYLTNNFTKRQLIIWLLGIDTLQDELIRTYREDGLPKSQIEVERDVETGTRMGGKVITWSYYPEGPVDTIIISQRDAADKEIDKKVIQHFLDGRQPEVTSSYLKQSEFLGSKLPLQITPLENVTLENIPLKITPTLRGISKLFNEAKTKTKELLWIP